MMLVSRLASAPLETSRPSPKCRQKFSLPPVDVVFADVGIQRLVPAASFLERHGERLQESTSNRFRIIRIDQHGASQSDCGANETGQDKDARIVGILSGDVFFRNQVHAVA